MVLLKLALKSLISRKVSTLITLFSITLSIVLILGVERIRQGAEESFNSSISQTDLIVGARASPIQLLFYTIFHMGSATNNLTWESYQDLKSHPSVEWTIPFSLGDSHRGYRVVATNEDFYQHYRFQGNKQVHFSEGQAVQNVFDVVLGSEVAQKLAYRVSDPIVVSHGLSKAKILDHRDKPFQVVGILKSTGTPIDRALYISLEGMEAIHMDWKNGAPPMSGEALSADQIQQSPVEIHSITSFLIKTKNRIDTLRLQREINTYSEEPLMAIIPGVVLGQLWKSLSYADNAMKAIAICVAFVSILGLLLSLYSSLNERRREMSILRSLGLGPLKLLSLLLFEASLLSLSAMFIGTGTLLLLQKISQPWLIENYGIFIPINNLSSSELTILGTVLGAALAIAFIPALTVYRRSLSEGLSPQ